VVTIGHSKYPDFIPTDLTTSHSTKLSKDDSQVAGYAALPKRGKQAIREADARKKFLAYISSICGAAKWCRQAIRIADARKFFLRLAFGRTQNF
jgi:hypothetical protein